MATIDPYRIRPDTLSVARYAALVYAIAASGLTLSGFAAAVLYSSPGLYGLLFHETGPSGFGWIVMALPPTIVFAFVRRTAGFGPVIAWALFLTFSAATGIAAAAILAFFPTSSADIAFLACAFSYFCLALIAWRARRDLSAAAKFVLAAIAGLSAAAIANEFLGSGWLDFTLAAASVLIFAALAAADTDRIRRIYAGTGSSPWTRAIIGALTLYFDLINLPLSVLGANRRRRETRR